MQHIVCLYANLSGMIPSHVAFDHIYWKILLLVFSIQSGLTVASKEDGGLECLH